MEKKKLESIKKEGGARMKDTPLFARMAKNYHDAYNGARRKGIEETRRQQMKEFGKKG